jgi:hypothetical protein
VNAQLFLSFPSGLANKVRPDESPFDSFRSVAAY